MSCPKENYLTSSGERYALYNQYWRELHGSSGIQCQ